MRIIFTLHKDPRFGYDVRGGELHDLEYQLFSFCEECGISRIFGSTDDPNIITNSYTSDEVIL